ncbi:MAG: hypothetical protein Q8P91_01750 [bacterium]|nr:hypothetical protein [bacterium]
MKEKLFVTPDLESFQEMGRGEIAEIVKLKGWPKCVAIMLDGTRRVLKLEPEYRDDKWLYYKNHIKELIYKSMEVADTFFDYGLNTVIGPLASIGNINRKNFMPEGLDRLLSPLADDYSISIIQKQNASISFYGDLDYIKEFPGGDIVEKYSKVFERFNPKNPEKHILLGIGFSTDTETDVIARQAIDYFKKNGKVPTHKDLIENYFGLNVPSIDIFIRTNEVRLSGGTTPLLTQHDTQLYFPVSPGILSLTEPVLRKIMYDYLFSRVLSHGMHEHSSINDNEASEIKDFYMQQKDNVLGIGRRVGDIWIHKQ